MMKHKHCQSCGVSLLKDPRGGGTYSDRTRSENYCGGCYQGGRFTEPDITVERMKEERVDRLHAQGYPKFFARLMVGNLHKLERWNAGAPAAPGGR